MIISSPATSHPEASADPEQSAGNHQHRQLNSRNGTDSGDAAARLAARLLAESPVSVARYMEAANAQYYATRDPLGAAGDFTTAPEISQMFGELVGAWIADLVARSGSATFHYAELGPGRGTLARDALRVLVKAGMSPPVHFVETSPTLRAAQATAVPQATWHDAVETLPTDAPLLIVANEFFDALPVHQYVRAPEGWHERLLDVSPTGHTPVLGRADVENRVPLHLRAAPPGSLFEASPASAAIVKPLSARLARQGGALLVIDYGHARSAIGETLQAVRNHAPAPVFEAPGSRDLTAHVDFQALAAAAPDLSAHGPVGQGAWLTALGLGHRAAALARADPARAADVQAARDRLSAPEQMGTLFKVMALVAPDWPHPEGFA